MKNCSSINKIASKALKGKGIGYESADAFSIGKNKFGKKPLDKKYNLGKYGKSK
jgi:hypothetical protein